MAQVPIVVVTGGAPDTLVTLAALKTLLGIVDGTQDAILDSQGAVVTAMLRSHLGRLVNDLSLVVTFPAVSQGRIWLPNPPITTVTTALLDGVAVADMTFNAQSGLLWGGGWIAGDDLVVTYEAGFDPVPAAVEDTYARLVQARVDAGGPASASASGIGAIKYLTVFDSHRVDYDTTASPGSAGELEPYEAVLRPYIYAGEYIV